MKNMKNNNITEAQLVLNNEVVVTDGRSQFLGQVGIVNSIMADGRTLDIKLSSGKEVFLDVTMVTDTALRESYNWPKQEQSLGPIANSVMKDTL